MNESKNLILFNNLNQYSKYIKLEKLSEIEYPNLVKWISDGRNEGFFKQDKKITIKQIKKYHSTIIKEGWEYHCYIIKVNSESVGYVDYKFKNKLSYIEGIFLKTKFRNKKIGSFVLKWVLAGLRLKGIKKVNIEVYEENNVSLKTILALGFYRISKRDRIENFKKVFTLELKLKEYIRFKNKFESYSKLKGDNYYQYHLAIAESIVAKLIKDNDVKAVVALGSISREFGDVWSDIDLVIIGNKSIFTKYWIGERWNSGYSIDMFLIDINNITDHNWEDSRRQAIGEGIVLYSRNKSIISNIRKAIKLKKEEKENKISELLLGIGWQGFQPQSWFNREVYGYYWSLSPSMWISRGSISAAHSSIDYSFLMLLKLIYLINNEIPPDNKWIYFLIDGLKWHPENFILMLHNYTKIRSNYNGFLKKYKIFSYILNSVIKELKKQKLIHENLFESYLKTIEEY